MREWNAVNAWLRRGVCLLAVTVPCGVAVPAARADDRGPGTVVGRVTSTSGKLSGRKIFVQAGGSKWALHLNDTSKIFHDRVQVSVHDIDNATWVKARGRRIGKLRLNVERLDIAGDRAAYRRSGAYRRSAPEGYFQPRYLD